VISIANHAKLTHLLTKLLFVSFVPQMELSCEKRQAGFFRTPFCLVVWLCGRAGASVQSTTGGRGVSISGSNAGDTQCSEVV